MNVTMMPMWIVSGVFFSAQRFPHALQPLIKLLPLTALIDVLRANMLQGASLAHVGFEVAVLTLWLFVLLRPCGSSDGSEPPLVPADSPLVTQLMGPVIVVILVILQPDQIIG